jgi:hypothetical protein
VRDDQTGGVTGFEANIIYVHSTYGVLSWMFMKIVRYHT